MKKICSTLEEDLVSLAEGRDRPEAAGHVIECADCARKLAQLKQVFAATSLIKASAPSSMLERAKGLMPAIRKVRALVLRTSFAGGARGNSSDFQAVFSAEDAEVRVSYSELATGWEIRGISTEPGYEVTVESGSVVSDASDGFSFEATDLTSSGFRLRSAHLQIEIPSAHEFLDGI